MNQLSSSIRLTISILILFVISLVPLSSTAQSIVNVNNLTGTANATIPVYNVTVGDFLPLLVFVWRAKQRWQSPTTSRVLKNKYLREYYYQWE